MQPAFFSLLLTAVHVCVLVECRPWLHHPEQQPQRQHSSLDRGAHADTPAGPARFYLELSGSVQRVAHRDSLGKSACMHTNSFITDGKEKLFNLKCKNFQIFIFQSSKLENVATEVPTACLTGHLHKQTRFLEDTNANVETCLKLQCIDINLLSVWTCFLPVVLPVRTDKRNVVSIFDLRRKRFICMDSNGELFISVSISVLVWMKVGNDCMEKCVLIFCLPPLHWTET